VSVQPDIRVLLKPRHEKALRGAEAKAALPASASSIPLTSGDLILPMPVNAHDHGYGIRTLDFGSLDDALETWIPTMRLRPRTDAYLETLVAFGRLAQTGVGATIHCHNSLNAARLVEEALQVIRAAKDVGIRLGLSCPLLDHDPWAYDGGPERLKPFMSDADWQELSPLAPRYAPFPEQLAAVEAVAKANTNPLVDVQYGPVGPQWCSNGLLEAIAEASASNNRRIHMHLLESPRQRAWLDRRFPQGIVRYLDDIGFLSPRLAVAHGVQLRPDEYELLAERGVQLPISVWGTTLLTARQQSETSVKINTVRQKVDIATLPQSAIDQGLALCTKLFGDRFVARDGLLAIALSNLNPQNHLGIALLNLTRMEKGEAWGQGEHVTPAVGSVIESLDAERLAIAETFGLSVRTVFEHFSLSFHVPMGSVSEMNQQMHSEGRGGMGPSTIDSRYIFEDVPFGLVPTALLGRMTGKPAVLHEAGTTLLAAATGRDLSAENDLLSELALSDMTLDQLKRLCADGF